MEKRRSLRFVTLWIVITLGLLAAGCGRQTTTTFQTPATIGPGTVSSTNNALVASYSVTVPAQASTWIQFGPDTNYRFSTSAQPSPTGGGMLTFLVAGMKASSTYHMQAVAKLSDGTEIKDSDHTFTTGALPGQSPNLKATTTTGMTPQSGVEMLELASQGPSPFLNVVATDLSGNVIWYYNGIPAGLTPNPVQLLPDGNVLINYSAGTSDGASSVLEEVDLAGNVVWMMNVNDLNQALSTAGFNVTVMGTHHDVAVLPNGHLIVIAAVQKNFDNLAGYPGTTTVTGDVLIDLDQNRTPVWVWSEFDHLDVNRHPIYFPDWTHTNAVLYSPSDHDLVISIRHQHWLVKIDYADGQGSGDIVWKLGWQGDFNLEGGTDPQDWFYAQHSPAFVGSNTSGTFQMILFDNGDFRQLDANEDVCGFGIACYSSVPLLTIDENSKTATIASRDMLAPVYSFFGGGAHVLANGNWEFDECATSSTPPSASVYEVTPDDAHQTVWNLAITGQWAYRAVRLPSLYLNVQW